MARDIFYRLTPISPNNQVTDITNAVILNFAVSLDGEYESTSAGGILTKIKTAVRFALDNNRMQMNPFAGVKIPSRTKEVEFLTQEEVHRIAIKELHSESLDRIRDLFLFQCYTGLAYVDMANLTTEDYQTNDMGQTFIRKKRFKTGVVYTAVLLPEALAIAEKYNFSLPVLSNQKYNSYLKEIAALCNITKPMHTHIGRHTAATYLLNKGLSLEVVAKILGHSSTDITKHYAKILDQTVFKDIKEKF